MSFTYGLLVHTLRVSAAIVAALVIKYPDRAVFDENRAGIPRTIATINPQNIEHILKHNFENYINGPQFNEATSDLFGHGIFNANGEQRKYQRKTASHIFSVNNFRDHITGLGFSVELNSLKSKEKIPFAASFDECQVNTFARFLNPVWKITEPLFNILHPWKNTFAQHLRTVDDFIYSVIEKRRDQLVKGATYHQDLLSRFMNARNEHGELLNDKVLRDIVSNFVLAGRDSTALVLSWTFYMLILHPRIEKKLLEEIYANVSDDVAKEPTALFEAIKSMTYAHAVFYEVLRLHPPIPANQRYALNDDVWPDGTAIKMGDYVVWSTWAQGRSESVWGANAKEFRPERWITKEGDLKRESPGRWSAFSAGPRLCLGQNLATLEALVGMILIVKKYKLILAAGQNITYKVSLSLPMKEGMKVFVEKR